MRSRASRVPDGRPDRRRDRPGGRRRRGPRRAGRAAGPDRDGDPRMIKGLAGPLLLFAVLDAFLRTQVRARSGAADGRDLADQRRDRDRDRPDALEHAPARAIVRPAGQAASDGARPSSGRWPARSRRTGRSTSSRTWSGYLPTSILRPIVENAIISIVILAVLGGLGPPAGSRTSRSPGARPAIGRSRRRSRRSTGRSR